VSDIFEDALKITEECIEEQVNMNVFTDEELKRLKEMAATPFESTCELAKYVPALLSRLALAEEKDCNQYHCGHATCNAWRKAASRE
jgi:hypothetical protein